MRIAHRIARQVERLFEWLFASGDIACDDPLATALPPYDAKSWPTCIPRIGETFDRYCRRARMSRERALLVEVWKVTAEPDYSGEWKTAHDRISRKRDELLRRDGFAS